MKRLGKALVFRRKFDHGLLTLLLALALFRDIFFQTFDQIQIVTGDVVIVILDLAEHIVVRLLEVVDVKILSLLDFMNLDLLNEQ